MIVWPLKTKSLLPSLYKREEFPLFGKEGLGEIFTTIYLLNYGLIGNYSEDWEIKNYPVRQTKNFPGRLFVLPFESTQMCWVSPSAITSS